MRGNRAPIAGRAICASMRPLDVYLYAFGAQSCATRLDLLRSARRGSLRPLRFARALARFAVCAASLRKASPFFGASPAPILTALGTSGTGKRFSLLVAPYAKSRRRSRRLRGVTRRNTSSAGYSLLVLRRVPPRIRRTAVPSFRCAHDSSLALLPEPP